MEYNIREKDQVVKAALVEEQSKVRKPLHHLAPLFPDLGESDRLPALNQKYKFFDNFLKTYKIGMKTQHNNHWPIKTPFLKDFNSFITFYWPLNENRRLSHFFCSTLDQPRQQGKVPQIISWTKKKVASDNNLDSFRFLSSCRSTIPTKSSSSPEAGSMTSAPSRSLNSLMWGKGKMWRYRSLCR